jgi:hypothetical protein
MRSKSDPAKAITRKTRKHIAPASGSGAGSGLLAWRFILPIKKKSEKSLCIAVFCMGYFHVLIILLPGSGYYQKNS